MSLSLHMELDKYAVMQDQLPEATIRLINDGGTLKIVNGRLLLAPAGFPARLHEISFFIKGPEGSANLKRFSINAGPPEPGNFVRLFPGEFIFQTYELSKYFHYDLPGLYTITAEYTNETQVVIHDTKSWTGKLKSNEAFFEITG